MVLSVGLSDAGIKTLDRTPYFRDEARKLQGDEYGGDSSDAREPCAKSYPDLDFLIERHGLWNCHLGPQARNLTFVTHAIL